jgi:hypothetical protein
MKITNYLEKVASPVPSPCSLFRLMAFTFGILVFTLPDASANIYTVNSTNGSSTSSGTLRWAINQANAHFGMDTIYFNINTTNPYTITLSSTKLPFISSPVLIDGYSQPGAEPATATSPAVIKVRVDGNVHTGQSPFHFIPGSENSTIRGLSITRDNVGVVVQNVGGIRIQGNYLGLTQDGLNDNFGNITGVRLFGADNCLIGGPGPADRNVISGNDIRGVWIDQNGPLEALNNIVQGNYVGTDHTGMLARPNGNDGMDNGPNDGTIIRNNVFSGNGGDGIEIDGSQTSINPKPTRDILVQGNMIGVAKDGVTPLGNGGRGIVVIYTTKLVVGGLSPSEANIIANNGRPGVLIVEGGTGGNFVFTCDSNTVSGNSIYNNRYIPGSSGLGIDLGTDNIVTPNDPMDADEGPNELQNFPVLDTVIGSAAGYEVQGSLNSLPNTSFRLEFFHNPVSIPGAINTPFPHGEGYAFWGYQDVTTDANGNVDFAINLPVLLSCSSGDQISATATNLATGATSEFSNLAEITCFTAPIPTMGQWGLFLFSLVICTLGVVFLYNAKRVALDR